MEQFNEFLLENNKNQIQKITDFLHCAKSLMLVSGFLGTGKNSVVKYALNSALPDAVVLEYNCFETTVLDDILLSFFDSLKKLTAQSIIEQPKTKSDDFVQKINAYFQILEKPVVIIIDSFEGVLKDNKQEILDFIFNLAPEIKVILISRVFNYEDFDGVEYKSAAVLALEKNIFEKYLRSGGITRTDMLTDELYKYTRGYFFYTMLSLRLMQLKNISLRDFMANYNKSLLSYNDFILREALSLVDPVSGHLFRFLTVMRHPVPLNLLQKLQLYNEVRANYFIQNNFLVKLNNQIYLEDYFKAVCEITIAESVAVKLHKGCVELYETQLPLKPLERDLLISRRTMRREIEYHLMFIPQRFVKLESSALPQPQFQEHTYEQPEITVPEEQYKDEYIRNMSFVFETDEAILDTIADSIEDYVSTVDRDAEELAIINKLSLVDLVNRAKQAETSFEFKKAVLIYQRALTLETDEDYYTFLPTLLVRTAAAYSRLSDWFNAVKYYELARDFYTSAADRRKTNEMNWEIAHIYYLTFKNQQAKTLLCEIPDCASDELKIKTYLLLADIDAENSAQYYEKALAVPAISVNRNVLSELYFKQALSLDEQNNPKQAVQFYKKCIDLGSNPKENLFLSSAYANIAIIFDETGNYDLALKYALESLHADELTGNSNGIYIALMKLAELYSSKTPLKALEYYEKALTCAQTLNEPFYIASANVALGDYFYGKDDQKSLEYYEKAHSVAQDNFSEDNLEKIKTRINDIKIRQRLNG